MTMRTAVTVMTMLFVSLAAPRARAQEQAGPAAELFRAGTAAHERGDHRAAAVAFEQANHLAPRAATLLNAALSWDAAGDKAHAADDFAGALQLPGLTTTQLAAVKTRLAELRRSLGLLHLHGPEGSRVSVGYVQDATLPLDVHLAPGEVTVRLSRPDGTTTIEHATVVAGEEKQLTFEARAVAPAPVVERPPPAREPPSPEPPHAETGLTSQQRWSIVAFGAAVASAGAATIVGLQALSAKRDFEQSSYSDVDAHDRASTYRTVTNVAWAASGVFAAAGVVLLVLPSSSKRPSGVALELRLAPQQLSCGARW